MDLGYPTLGPVEPSFQSKPHVQWAFPAFLMEWTQTCWHLLCCCKTPQSNMHRMVCVGVALIVKWGLCLLWSKFRLSDILGFPLKFAIWVILMGLSVYPGFIGFSWVYRNKFPLQFPLGLSVYPHVPHLAHCRKPCPRVSMSCYCGMEPLSGVPLGPLLGFKAEWIIRQVETKTTRNRWDGWPSSENLNI